MTSDKLTDQNIISPYEPTDRELLQRIWRLAVPVLVQQALIYLVGVSDTLITGWYLSSDDLAAVTIATYISWFLGGLMAVVSAGSSALVARMVGAGDYTEANRITGVSMTLAILVGFLIQFFGLIAAGSIVTGINMTGASADAATIYFRIVVAVGPLIAIRIVGMSCMAGAGDTRTGSIIMGIVNAINVMMSWALVVGLWGLPTLGIAGVAAGTATGEGVGGILVLISLIRGRAGLKLSWVNLRPSLARIRRIVRISLPTVGETATGIAGQVWYLSLINRLGAISTAAHGVAIKCESISYLMVGGFAAPAGILAGQFLGSAQPQLAKRAANLCWALGMALLAGLGVLLFYFDEEMFYIFLGTGKPELIVEGAPMLPVVAFAMPGLATINVLATTFRGAGETRTPWFNTMTGLFLFRIPVTYALARPEDGSFWAMGLKGAWIAMLVDLNLRGLLLAIRYFKGTWTQTKI
ncbi:MAG: hypothetical protein RJA81_806 [Planctomycetota bacterium]